MNKFLMLAIASLPFAATAQDQKQTFSLKGKLAGTNRTVETVYLTYKMNGKEMEDSSIVKHNAYSFSGSLDEPVEARLEGYYTENNKRQYSSGIIFLESGKISVRSTGLLSDLQVSGSKSHAAYEDLTRLLSPLTAQNDILRKEYQEQLKKKDVAGIAAANVKIKAVYDSMNTVYINYAEKNPASPLA